MFWILAGLAVVTAVALVIRPILRPNDTDAADADVAVYRDQIKEIDRDLARGVLDQTQAATTRAEIGRRLLAATERAPTVATNTSKGANAVGISFIVLILAVGTGAVYIGSERPLRWLGMDQPDVATLQDQLSLSLPIGDGSISLSPVYTGLGRPGMEDMPLASRDFAQERPTQESFEQSVAAENTADEVTPSANDAELMEQLKIALASRPDDVTGHLLMAQSAATLRRYGDAWRAQQRVVEIKGDTATSDDFATLAEYMIFAARGFVSAKAEDALSQALTRDPINRRARYYSGAALAQNGEPELAMRLWGGLLMEGPANAPWKQPVREQARQLSQNTGIPMPNGTASPGPSQEDVEAAQDMSDEDRQEMIRGMVEGLADRLATDGGTSEEWARLIRALGVLGDTERARAIAQEAQTVFAGQDAALQAINDAAGTLPQ